VPRTPIFAVLLGLVLATSARGQELATERVDITLKARKAKTSATYAKQWHTVCERLGKALTVGRGPWGLGVFSSFTCDGKGDAEAAADGGGAAWTLAVADGAAGLALTLSQPVGDEMVAAAKLKLPPSTRTMTFFGDEEVIDLVAFDLLDQLPAAGKLTKARLRGAGGKAPTFTGRYWRAGHANDFKFDVPEAPESLTLYRLRWDGEAKLWRSEVVGTAKRTKVVEPKTRKVKKRARLAGGEVVYETTPAVAEALQDGPLWLHASDGPGQRGAKLDELVADAQTDLDKAATTGKLKQYLRGDTSVLLRSLKDTLASGYVGLRYGLEVLPGTELVKKTSFFGLLVEIRGGPAKGLRYYYDRLRPVSDDVEGADGTKIKTSLAWSRHVIGYSFGFEPGFLVDRITIDPKLGVWNFEAVLPVKDPTTGEVQRAEELKLGRTASLAIEVGLEELSSWYTLRGWAAHDTGFSLLKNGGQVTSNRFGLDVFLSAGPRLSLLGVPTRISLLGFFFYESVEIATGDDDVEPGPGEVVITSVPYDAGYAGLGAVVSW
jgi:hypothetical protein